MVVTRSVRRDERGGEWGRSTGPETGELGRQRCLRQVTLANLWLGETLLPYRVHSDQ